MSAVVDTLTLTAEDAIGLVERSEISAAELHAAYLEAIGRHDGELHCYLRTVGEADGAGIPIALKDVISTRGVETTAGSRILSGYVPVFDATVHGTHNFVAEGLVVHNSLEQDSDVVIFLYRDEIYNPESDQRGTAEVIVAKHRNGPTGMTRLAFLDHLTKFANMARE